MRPTLAALALSALLAPAGAGAIDLADTRLFTVPVEGGISTRLKLGVAADLGPLVGSRTWGGLAGILGFPVPMDGGTVTAPNLAIWTEDGFIVENEGVPPDLEVEQTPKDVIAGRGPQLAKAIEIVLAELAKRPPAVPKRPPYPLRAKP